MASAHRNRGIHQTLLTAAGWLILYFILVATPVLILLIGPRQPGTGFWWDVSLALGYSGMGMMGIQFALTARFRRATAPFGIDTIYYFHRYLAVAALGLIVLHVGIVTMVNPAASGLINPRASTWYVNLGIAALFLFIVVVITSLLRKCLHIPYEVWRRSHGLMAAVAFVAAIAHILGSDTYIADAKVKALWTAFTAVWLLLIAYVRIFKPWRLKRRPYRVVDVRRERGRVWTLTVAPERHDGLSFRAGQFAWLTIAASPFAQREHPFAHQIPVALFGIELHGEAADIALGVRRPALARNGREAHEHIGLLADLRKYFRLGVAGDVMGDGEGSVGAGPLGVHATLGNDLPIEMSQLL